MRLLHTKRLELQEFGGKEVPHYAILSHTWGKGEVTLQDIKDLKTNRAMKLLGYEKVSMACSVAAANRFEYIWIDTCCIDKTSSAELSEALNSMYRWYQEAEECYAYLADVSQYSVNRVTGVTGPEFRKSKWFTRGWTLQELIAPLSVMFLDKQWQEIGTKSDLQRDISEITKIPGSFLLGDDIRNASVAQRMSWASKRETTRTEDLAYCLMGLFGIYMPMLYGEGERAFIRLQEEIMRVSDDHSLFAWRSIEDHGGILANSPAAFAESGNIIPVSRAYATSSPSTLSSRGIHLSLRFINDGQQGQGLAILDCTEIGKERMRLALRLKDIFQTNEDFVREQSTKLPLIDLEDINILQNPLTSLNIRQWHPTRNRKWEDMEKCVVKLTGVDGQEVTSRITNFDSNCELSDGLIIMNIAGIPDGILSRLLVVCKDGNFFQILLKKYGRSL
ncbi:heterokaryon incompatibility protein-domain-containing protein, partial [Bisporella sp. PMI_857]